MALTAWFAGLVPLVLPLLLVAGFPGAAISAPLELKKGDHVVLIGNTLAERMQYFGNFETQLHSRLPQHELVVRNLGWSADEVALRPRQANFQDHPHKLEDHKADVVLALFGFNESFAGQAGLAKFENELQNFVKETIAAQYNGQTNCRLVLVSPIAHENLKRRELTDGKAANERLKLYTDAMAKFASMHEVLFVDLFTPSLAKMATAPQPWTINGVHLNEYGDQQVAGLLSASLLGPPPPTSAVPDLGPLKAAVNVKNLEFFYDYRAVNGCYIYGGRKNPFGVVNFPAELAKLRKMIDNRDRRVWAIAQGKSVPATIDDSDTGELPVIATNFGRPITITSPDDSQKQMALAPGYEVNLFASEVEFPDLKKPVQMTFDNKGRLWVCTMESYPHYLPGRPVSDKVLIFEDTDGDGKADKQTVFADKLYLPTGLELAQGGLFVSQQPNLLFLKDTDGDDRADVRELVLHGFDSADSHHALHAFFLGPGGELYFQEGVFHFSQIETPYGPRRLKNAGVFRYEPRTAKLDIFVSYGFANPWGHIIDRWGQNLVADASPGFNYYGTAFSGDVDYPQKHATMPQFLKMQWRPTGGCELVSSRNFPDEAQGNYLLNNCIGFQGVLQYKVREDKSGFAADPLEPLLKSSDPNFRPVDLEFGPDGALYVVDWFNPLVGHMQHSLRDPNRDTQHGRIWRIRYKDRALVQPPKIVDESIASLLHALKSTPEDRACYRIRRELGARDTSQVMDELQKWQASLSSADESYSHALLEALWLHQSHDVVDEPLLKLLLRSPDYRVRAAATRVLCYWRDRVDQPIELLRVQIGDEHPRVRLEAVRALSFFDSQQAFDASVLSLAQEQDQYLDYTLKETMATLDHRNKNQPTPYETAAPLVALFKGGKLPPERMATVAEMICRRGGSNDLRAVYEQASSPRGLAGDVRRKALAALVDAAATRKVAPAGDLSGLGRLVAAHDQSIDQATQKLAVRLVGLWRVESLAETLTKLASAKDTRSDLRESSLAALAALGGAAHRDTIEKLAAADQPLALRFLAVAALARLEVDRAVVAASKALAEGTAADDPAPLVAGFLDLQGGSEKLAAALGAQMPPADVAKLALRAIYANGRSDAALVTVLSKAAGIHEAREQLTPEAMAVLVAEVANQGDSARGENIFRRADLNCTKCHAVSKGGGNVGPDLSSVGSISPVDYLVNSILFPDLAIKEQFLTASVVTNDGRTFQGTVVSKDDQRLVLKDANGQQINIAIDDIDEQVPGHSLMPKGLANFLTHAEFVDLVRFLSELGKPGPYAIRSAQIMQRWRWRKPGSEGLPAGVPDEESFRRHILGAPGESWQPVYAKVAGRLPVAELAAAAGNPVVYLYGEIEVTVAGAVVLACEKSHGLSAWLDESRLPIGSPIPVDLAVGRHRVTLRVDTSERDSEAGGEPDRQDLRLELIKPRGSSAQATVVDGP